MMEDIVYDSVKRYFDTLKYVGHMSQGDVNKLLILIAIYEITYWDFRGYINRWDYASIHDALYQIFGKTCLVPYPNFCKLKDMNKLHIGDISELLHRVKKNEADIKQMQDTAVVKTLGNVIEEVEDIEFPVVPPNP